MLFGPFGQDDEVHLVRQHKSGANSFSLTIAGGPTYHFRSHDYRTIEIYDSFKHGTLVTAMSTGEEAEQLMDRLATGSLGAPAPA